MYSGTSNSLPCALTAQTKYIQEHGQPRRFTGYKYLANLVLLTHPTAGTSRLLIKLTLLA